MLPLLREVFFVKSQDILGRNGNEVAIHECPIAGRTIDFGLLPFGRVWICRYCGKELNAAIDGQSQNDRNNGNTLNTDNFGEDN